MWLLSSSLFSAFSSPTHKCVGKSNLKSSLLYTAGLPSCPERFPGAGGGCRAGPPSWLPVSLVAPGEAARCRGPVNWAGKVSIPWERWGDSRTAFSCGVGPRSPCAAPSFLLADTCGQGAGGRGTLGALGCGGGAQGVFLRPLVCSQSSLPPPFSRLLVRSSGLGPPAPPEAPAQHQDPAVGAALAPPSGQCGECRGLQALTFLFLRV